MVDYMDSRFFADILAVLPVDYFLLIFGASQQTVAWVRALRILKLYKPFDYIRIWRKHSNVKIALFTLFLLTILFVVISHLMGCVYFFIGKYEVGRGRRYDGQTLFENTIDRDFLTLQPVLEMSIIEQYVHFVYLSACTMGAVMYGDMIPLTLSEQLFDFVAMFTARIYLAFLYAEAAAYLSSVHSAYSNHVRVRSTIIKYLELHHLPIKMKKRVYNYHEILWENFKGINESEILGDLPESIQKQIKFSLFNDLIKNVTLFPKDDKAAISALISRLELQLISKGEYVIRDGEIADCMYFILRGSVKVIKNGVVLATLEQGSHFGEMALAERKPTIRTASALCITPVSVGSLSIHDFNIICNSYPIFEAKITEEVDKRKQDLLDKTKQVEDSKMTSINRSVSKKQKPRRSEFNKNIKSPLSSYNKGSRQSVYQIEDESGIQPRVERLSVFEANKHRNSKSKKSSILSEEQYLTQIKQQANSILDANESKEAVSQNQNDESITPLVIQENPNMPDSAIIPNPDLYQGDDMVIGDEEEEKSESYKSQSEESSKRSSLIKKSGKSKSSSSSGSKHGEAAVKLARPKCVWVKRLITYKSMKFVFKCVMFMVCLYNIVFIPLQGGFRIEYGPPFIVMEVFTLIMFFIDILLIFNKHKNIVDRLNNLKNHDPASDRKLWRSLEDEKKSLKNVRIYLVLSIISWLPIALFCQLIELDEPLLIIFYAKCFRLFKLQPILRFFSWVKQRALNFGRIVEALFLYYSACHIIACSFINIAYKQDDIRETWMRRIPVPQEGGMRTENNLDDISFSSIYIHALNFTFNTVSHLAIGEMTMINYRERIYNAFIILCGTFIYAFCFGNVASIMADFAPQMFFYTFHKKFEDVMGSLKKDAVPPVLIHKIKDYFDYVWANSKGISYNEILGGLPSCLNADILFARYADAIQNSIIFKDDDNQVDSALTNSILTMLEYRVYMDGDFIVIGGSSSMNTYIFLEGEAIVMGLNEEFIAYIKSGGHYSNDLDPDDENLFNYKRPLHIVSKGISIIGILNIQKLNELYVAYPELKNTLRVLNKHFVNYTSKF